MDNQVDTLITKNFLNQFIHLLNIILNISQDIKNSIYFCKLGVTLHSLNELLNEQIKSNAFSIKSYPFQ